jgi:hypothetical protein
MSDSQKMQWQLDEAAATQAELRAVIDVLLREGEAVFASRRWRWGSALLRPLEFVLRRAGRDLPPAQDIAHWRGIVDAHAEAIARRHALLQQLTHTGERNTAEALAQLWRDVSAASSGQA